MGACIYAMFAYPKLRLKVLLQSSKCGVVRCTVFKVVKEKVEEGVLHAISFIEE